MRTAETAQTDRFVLSILALSLLLNVILAIGLVRVAMMPPAPGSARQPPTGPPIGTIVPALEVQSHDGKSQKVEFSDSALPTVIYIVTPGCVWCERNGENIKALAQKRAEYRFVGVSLRGKATPAPAANPDLPLELTYMNPSLATAKAWGLAVTPQMFVVSPAGELLKTWRGAFVGQTAKEIEEYFGVKLPGIREQNSDD